MLCYAFKQVCCCKTGFRNKKLDCIKKNFLRVFE
uniref:Uncharacterized protein n=1 Tax=Anguilla anguilla TaxID=7936 RepID=A0A0E9XG77_ANGAN